MLRIVSCSSLQVQLQFPLAESAHPPSLLSCVRVRPSFPPPSCSSRVALVGEKKIKSLPGSSAGCEVRTANTGACYARHGASVLGKQVLTQLQGWLWGGDLHPWEGGNDATRARKGWQANGRWRHAAPEWDLLSSLPARQWELQRGTGHLHCSVPPH